MTDFIDPRTHSEPRLCASAAELAASLVQLEGLHRLCREGRIYDIEAWIQAGQPLQLGPEARLGGRRMPTALGIALETGQYALVLLLLCNGYRLDLELASPFTFTLRARRWDLVDLLWTWGADPLKISPYTVFDTYNSVFFERFYAAGTDLTAQHELARALAYHTSNKPLFGFAKRHRDSDPRFQVELNIALGQHAHEGNRKGVHLCLWAGADPHAPAPDLQGDRGEEAVPAEGNDRFIGLTAVEQATWQGHIELFDLLKPDPARDDFASLYLWAHDGETVEALARIAPPGNVGPILQHHLSFLDSRFPWFAPTHGGTLRALEAIFRVGGRWAETTAKDLKAIRYGLRRANDGEFAAVLNLLAQDDHCNPDILRELARSGSLRQRMARVGLLPSPSPKATQQPSPSQVSGSRRMAAKLGFPMPKVKPIPPRMVTVGELDPRGTVVRLDRRGLYARVWAEPVESLAKAWGLSGRGLAKVCQRMGVPVPPRGYWAKVLGGQHPRRLPLKETPGGNPVEIVIHVPPKLS